MRFFSLLAGLLLALNMLAAKKYTEVTYFNTQIEIKSISEATYSYEKRWTVFHEDYDYHAYVHVGYDEFRKIKKLSLNIYDSQGNRIEKLDKKDFRDVSASSGFEVTDARFLIYEYTPSVYPFTVEFSYEIDWDGILGLPTWTPIEHFGEEIHAASLTIKCPLDYSFQHKTHLLESPEIENVEEQKIYSWKVKEKLDVLQNEEYAVIVKNREPHVMLAPQKFRIEKFDGDFDSWAGLGSWCSKLLDERNELSEETKTFLKARFGSIDDPKLRAEAVYKWMQSKTRYISVQLGIGGWQPMKASLVDEVGYGDCKALSNYTKAALEAVGIESNYCLVYSGVEDKVEPAFPAQSFNHAILCIPFDGDTAWLECTSQITPYNFMSRSTAGHKALVIAGDNSKLVTIRDDYNKVFEVNHTTKIELLENRVGAISTKSAYKKLGYASLLGLESKRKDDLIDMYKRGLNKSGAYSFNYELSRNDSAAQICEDVSFEMNDFYRKTGESLLIDPMVYVSAMPQLPQDFDRQSDLYFRSDLIEESVITLEFPYGYTLEFVPEDVNVNNSYCNVSVNYTTGENSLQIKTYKKRKAGTFSKAEYNEVRDQFTKLAALEHRKIALKQKI